MSSLVALGLVLAAVAAVLAIAWLALRLLVGLILLPFQIVALVLKGVLALVGVLLVVTLAIPLGVVGCVIAALVVLPIVVAVKALAVVF